MSHDLVSLINDTGPGHRWLLQLRGQAENSNPPWGGDGEEAFLEEMLFKIMLKRRISP